jgi:hypothetical protein
MDSHQNAWTTSLRRAELVRRIQRGESPRATPAVLVAQVEALRRARWTGTRIPPAVAHSRTTAGRLMAILLEHAMAHVNSTSVMEH